MGGLTRTLVIGDVHGRQQKMWNVLVRAGAVDPVTLEKNPLVHVIQLGDLVSLGYDEEEYAFYTWALKYLDLTLTGNHEQAACYHNDRHVHLGYDADRFNGWHIGRDREAERLVRQRFRAGSYQVATSVGKWLICHAGVLPRYQRQLGMFERTAEENAKFLNDLFYKAMEERTSSKIFEGPSSIFWVRIGELRNGYGTSAKHVPLVVGHSVYGPEEVVKDKLWVIDSPPSPGERIHGGVCGLLFDENDEVIQMIFEQ